MFGFLYKRWKYPAVLLSSARLLRSHIANRFQTSPKEKEKLMGTCIVKVLDRYCEWSTVVDAPISEFVDRTKAIIVWSGDRVQRADALGDSMHSYRIDALSQNHAGSAGECINDPAELIKFTNERAEYFRQLNSEKKPEYKLRVSHFPQVPCKPFVVGVFSIEEGVRVMDTLAEYDAFQLKHNIKPDYSNAAVLQMFEDGEWTNWSNDHTDDPGEWLEMCKPPRVV